MLILYGPKLHGEYIIFFYYFVIYIIRKFKKLTNKITCVTPKEMSNKSVAAKPEQRTLAFFFFSENVKLLNLSPHASTKELYS